MSQTTLEAKPQGQDQEGPQFAIERVYVKGSTFVSPSVPDIFKTSEYKPEVKFEMKTENNALDSDRHEVVLEIKVTATNKANGKENIAFEIKVQQAGIFLMKDITGEDKERLLGSYCPNLLYPYVRETISNRVNRGGFPEIYLAPMNFDDIYQQYLEKKKEEEEKAARH